MSDNKLLKVPNKEAVVVELAVFDFDGVFTDNTVYVNDKGEETVRCWRGDGLGLARLKNAEVKIWVISTEKNPVVKVRCQKLNIDCQTGLADKKVALVKLMEKLDIDQKEVMYVGNDINDVECLKIVGVPIVVSDATSDTKRIAKFITKLPGGFGAVREVCDWIVACKNYKKEN